MKSIYTLLLVALSIMFIAAACEEEDNHPDFPEPVEEVKWRLADSTQRMYINDFMFVDEQYGWAVGMRTGSYYANGILYTRDGGWHWDDYAYPPDFNYSSMTSLFFVDRNTGWVCGTQGVILHTKDGGATWTQQNSNTTENLNSIVFKDSQRGRAVGSNSTVLVTLDGGNTWNKSGMNKASVLLEIDYQYNKAIALGWNGYPQFFIADDGVNFTEYTINTNSSPGLMVEAFSWIDHTAIWVTGQGGLIAKTEDEGHTWIVQEAFDYPQLYDIFFLDKTYGWAVGREGTILKTENGGNTWIDESLDENINFKAVQFLKKDLGWALSDFKMYRYSERY